MIPWQENNTPIYLLSSPSFLPPSLSPPPSPPSPPSLPPLPPLPLSSSPLPPSFLPSLPPPLPLSLPPPRLLWSDAAEESQRHRHWPRWPVPPLHPGQCCHPPLEDGRHCPPLASEEHRQAEDQVWQRRPLAPDGQPVGIGPDKQRPVGVAYMCSGCGLVAALLCAVGVV